MTFKFLATNDGGSAAWISPDRPEIIPVSTRTTTVEEPARASHFLVVFRPERGTDARVHTFPFASHKDAWRWASWARGSSTNYKIVEVEL